MRVRVDEFRFVAGDRRAIGVGEPAIDSKRRGFRFAPERDCVLDRKIPRMVEVEIGNRVRQPVRIGETCGRILRGVAGDGERFRDGRVHRVGGEIGGARVAAPLADQHGDADPLVAVVGDGFDLAAADGDALPDRLRHLGFGRRGATGLGSRKHGFARGVRALRSAAGNGPVSAPRGASIDTNRGGVAAAE